MADSFQNYSDSLRQGTRDIVKDIPRKQDIKEKIGETIKGIAEPLAVDKGQDLVKGLVSSSKTKAENIGKEVAEKVRGKIAGIGKEVRGATLRTKSQGKRSIKQAINDTDDLTAKINKLIPTKDSMKVFNQKPSDLNLSGGEKALSGLSDEKIFPWDKPEEGIFSKIKSKVKSLYEGVPSEEAPSGGSILAQVSEDTGKTALKDTEKVVAKKVEKKVIGKAFKQGGEDLVKGEAGGSEAGGFLDPAVDIASLALGIGGIVKGILHKPKPPQVQHINSSFQVGL